MKLTNLLLLLAPLLAAAPPDAKLQRDLANLPRYFEPSLGGREPGAQFVARAGNATVHLHNAAAIFRSAADERVALRFIGAKAAPQAEPQERQPGISYYAFQPGKSAVAPVPHFSRVRYRDLYPGVDIVYYFQGDQLEYDLILKPNADPSRIRFRYENAEIPAISPDGHLRVKTAAGELRQLPPHVYQNGREIPARYRIDNGAAAFDLAVYDRSQPLTIDPVIALGSGFGGSKRQEIHDIFVDAAGAIYLTGTTQPENFPATYSLISNGLAPITESGSWAFIAKLVPVNGQLQLAYSTVLGFHGQGAVADHIGVDQSGNAYVSGKFGQNPWVFNTLGPQCASRDGHIFVTRFRVLRVPPGVDYLHLDYNMSPVKCGNENYLEDMAVSAGGAVYLAGWTNDSNFLQEKGLPNAHPGTNGFVLQVLPPEPGQVRAQIGFSTLYGGSNSDRITGLALGPGGDLFITGETKSVDIPLAQPFQSALFNPYTEAAFLARLKPPTPDSGQTWRPVSVVNATLFSGNRRTTGEAIAVDAAGNAYIAGHIDFQGYANSVTFPTVRGLPIPAEEEAHGFLAMFPPPAPGQNLAPRFATRLDVNSPEHIALDNRGGIYVAGQALQWDFKQVNPLQLPAFVPRYFLARYWQPSPDANLQTDYATWVPIDLYSIFWSANHIYLAGSGSPASQLVNNYPAPNLTAYFMKIRDRVDITVTSNFPGRQVTISGSGCGINGTRTTPVILPATPRAQCVIAMNPAESTADTRYTFTRWSDGASEASRTLTVGPENATYTAEYSRQFRLNSRVQPANAGTIAPSGITWQNEGVTVQHNANANACYLLSNWSSGSANGFTLIEAPKEAVAYFTANAASATSAAVVTLAAQTAVNGFIRQQVTVRNASNAPLYNASLVLDNLSRAATLQKASGFTECAAPAGSPFVNLGTLSAGEVKSFTLTFAASTPVTFSTRVLHGLKPR